MTDKLDLAELKRLAKTITEAQRVHDAGNDVWYIQVTYAEEDFGRYAAQHREALIAAAEEHANQSALQRRVEALTARVMNEPRNVALERLAEENEALLRCVVAAEAMARTVPDYRHDDLCGPFYEALDALRSGKPAPEERPTDIVEGIQRKDLGRE